MAYIKKSKKTMDFIVEAMETEDLLLDQVLQKYPTKCPHRSTVYKWQREEPEFNERVTNAYYQWLMSRAAELDYLSKARAEDLYPDLDFRERAEARRTRIDTLKYITSKLGPVLDRRFTAKQEVTHKGEVTMVNIIDYSKEK